VQVLVLVPRLALIAFVEKGQQPHSRKHGFEKHGFEDAVVYASYWKQSRKEEISQGVYSRITILDEPVDMEDCRICIPIAVLNLVGHSRPDLTVFVVIVTMACWYGSQIG